MFKSIGYFCHILHMCGKNTHQIMIRIFHQKLVIVFFVLGTGIILGPSTNPVAAQNNHSFMLRNGVIIDTERNQAYIMNTEGGIDAVELTRGTLVWHTDQADKPLALEGNQLACQVQPKNPGNNLDITILNVEESGSLEDIYSIELPPDVRISINETLNSSFTARARIVGGEIFVSWNYTFHPRKGTAPLNSSQRKQTSTQPSDQQYQPVKGAARINLSTKATSTINVQQIPASLTPVSPYLSGNNRLAGVPERQFISANGNHVLGSKRIESDSVWSKYQWIIYDHVTGNRIAVIKNHLSYSPYFVNDGQIIFETGSYIRRIDNVLVKKPLKIMSVDLQNGRELWSWPIRDTRYRGPFPP